MNTPVNVSPEGDISNVSTLREQFSRGLRALADRILADPAKANFLEKQVDIAHKVYKQRTMELAEKKLRKRPAEVEMSAFVSRKKRRASGELVS